MNQNAVTAGTETADKHDKAARYDVLVEKYADGTAAKNLIGLGSASPSRTRTA
jgi:hypothetical protein